MWLANLHRHTPRQAELVDRLVAVVEETDEHRALAVSCSFGRGNADEWSDIDAAVSHTITDENELELHARRVVGALGDLVDLYVHHLDGFGTPTRRAAVEYVTGVQLDLVFMPRAARTYHLAGEEVVLVDKDNAMSSSFTPPVDELAERTAARADEYLHFAWWMLSDVAKYLQRRSWYEAVERLGVVRDYTLRLAAIGARTRFPQYGLISLIDFAPDGIPPALGDTYPSPSEPTAIVDAALTLADLLDEATAHASTVIGRELSTGWAATARSRLLASSSAIRGSRGR